MSLLEKVFFFSRLTTKLRMEPITTCVVYDICFRYICTIAPVFWILNSQRPRLFYFLLLSSIILYILPSVYRYPLLRLPMSLLRVQWVHVGGANDKLETNYKLLQTTKKRATTSKFVRGGQVKSQALVVFFPNESSVASTNAASSSREREECVTHFPFIYNI